MRDCKGSGAGRIPRKLGVRYAPAGGQCKKAKYVNKLDKIGLE